MNIIYLHNLFQPKNLVFRKIPGTDYEMQITPVTQYQYKHVMDTNPSHFVNMNAPVEMVFWDDTQIFIQKLNDKNDSYLYRLPTEQEWEYCAKPCDNQKIEDIAWSHENSNKSTQRVGLKKPNELGLYDMLGNVWEWTSTLEGSFRVIRGGSWLSHAQILRSAYRINYSPGLRYQSLGFRLLRTLR